MIVKNPYEAIKIDSKSGSITFDDSIPNYTQIMVVAKSDDKYSDPCVVTLKYDYKEKDF